MKTKTKTEKDPIVLSPVFLPPSVRGSEAGRAYERAYAEFHEQIRRYLGKAPREGWELRNPGAETALNGRFAAFAAMLDPCMQAREALLLAAAHPDIRKGFLTTRESMNERLRGPGTMLA